MARADPLGKRPTRGELPETMARREPEGGAPHTELIATTDLPIRHTEVLPGFACGNLFGPKCRRWAKHYIYLVR